MRRLLRSLIDFVMTGDPTRLLIWGIAIVTIIAIVVIAWRRLRLFDPLEPPSQEN